MFDSLYTVLTAGTSSALTTLLTCLIMRYLIKRGEEQKRRAEEELAAIKEAQWKRLSGEVEALEKKLDIHISADQTGVVMTTLRTIGGNIEKLLDQQQMLISSDAEQRSQITTLFKAAKEQKEELKECKKEHQQ